MATQVNFRIDPQLKRKGEEVFAQGGISSSEAVRMLYEFAVANAANPKKVVSTLSPIAAEQKREALIAAFNEGSELIDRVSKLGLSGSSTVNLPYDELREAAYLERFGA